MVTYYVVVAVLVVMVAAVRKWVQLVREHRSTDSAWTDPEISKTLKVGHRYTSDRTYDQSKTTAQQRLEDARAARRRARAAKTIKDIQAKPAKVTPMRQKKGA